MSAPKLEPKAAQDQLAALSGWTMADDKLQKTFRFDDFVSAIAFMAAAAFEAEQRNHHPNWANVYNRVEVTLWTHDVGGLTELDFSLAAAMDRRASKC